MRLLYRLSVSFVFLLLTCISLNAQNITISGKITDATTKEPINFATVSVKGTSTGTNSNFDGLYRLEFARVKDSVIFSCIGYLSRSVYVTKSPSQKY